MSQGLFLLFEFLEDSSPHLNVQGVCTCPSLSFAFISGGLTSSEGHRVLCHQPEALFISTECQIVPDKVTKKDSRDIVREMTARILEVILEFC